jgi:hypothetical protein
VKPSKQNAQEKARIARLRGARAYEARRSVAYDIKKAAVRSNRSEQQ